MANLNQIIGKLNQDYEETLVRDTGEAYSKLSTIFEELGLYLREYIQNVTKDDIKKVVQKLKHGERLTPEDLQQIKLWIVGDAEYYMQLESNVGEWKAELKRIMGQVNALNINTPDIQTACKLRALFRDAARVLADIFYFYQQKDRVEKFTESTQSLDIDERELLVRLLEQRMSSPEF